MSELCGIINAGVAVNCTSPPQAGTEDTLVLMNRRDIETIVKNGSNPQIIEDLILASAANGFVFEGLNNSIAPKYNEVKGRYINGWSHEVSFIGFNVSPEAKKQYEAMKDADLVAVIYNKYRGTTGNSAFEIYGLYAGLRSSAMERDLQNKETQGCISITLKTDEDRGLEPFQPQNFFITDYNTSLAAIEGLL